MVLLPEPDWPMMATYSPWWKSTLTPLSGVRILVVDDFDDGREVLRQILAHYGATVTTASSAREALAGLDELDVIVTDYSMPGDTGLWLLERVRERGRSLPIIVLTGYAERQAAELRKAPFARVLRKPVDPWALCEEIRGVLGLD